MKTFAFVIVHDDLNFKEWNFKFPHIELNIATPIVEARGNSEAKDGRNEHRLNTMRFTICYHLKLHEFSSEKYFWNLKSWIHHLNTNIKFQLGSAAYPERIQEWG